MINRRLITIYVFFALLTACTLFVCFMPLITISLYGLIIDSVIAGVLLSVSQMLLIHGLRYGNFNSLLFSQKIVIYIALAVLFLVCWLGLEFSFTYLILPETDWQVLQLTIPTRCAIGLLVYCLVGTNYFFSLKQQEIESDIEAESIEQKDCSEDKNITEKSDDNIIKDCIEHVAVKNGQKIDVIPVLEIMYLQAEGDYVMIHSIKGKFLKEQTMKSFENSLPPNKFVRVHRSSIINIDYISQIELYEKQNQLLKLKNGAQVKVSITGYKLLRKKLDL